MGLFWLLTALCNFCSLLLPLHYFILPCVMNRPESLKFGTLESPVIFLFLHKSVLGNVSYSLSKSRDDTFISQQIVSCVHFTQPVLMACFLQLTFQTKEKFLTFCFQLLKIKHFFDPGMMSLLCNSLVCLILSCGLFRGCYFNGFKCYSVTVFYEFVFHRVNGFGKHNRKWHVCAGVCEKEREKEGGREKKILLVYLWVHKATSICKIGK